MREKVFQFWEALFRLSFSRKASFARTENISWFSCGLALFYLAHFGCGRAVSRSVPGSRS